MLMLMPKRVKWRKQMRGRMTGKASARRRGLLRRIRSAWRWSRAGSPPGRSKPPAVRIVREMKRRGKVWIRIFPAKPYTHRPPETRMGSGKGNVEYYVAVVKPGRVMFEVGGLPAKRLPWKR